MIRSEPGQPKCLKMGGDGGLRCPVPVLACAEGPRV